ncbi:MAG: hypothetical protein GVY11_08275 [Gammaproteobacteria bacterium]|jgi:hypothetical protein|nr:hypothetical protein [Gammaproteobacteria bacterium]
MANDPNSQVEQPAAVDRRRRRLIRVASLAGPAVITLQSGRAWAVSNCAPDQGFTAFRTHNHEDRSAADIQNDALAMDGQQDYGHSSQIEALMNVNYSC